MYLKSSLLKVVLSILTPGSGAPGSAAKAVGAVNPETATAAATASSIFAVMERTHDAGSREILLVDAQEAIASPPMQFAVTQLR